MATERDIDGALSALAQALVADDEAAGKAAVIALAGGVLKDIARIADALEILATRGVTQ